MQALLVAAVILVGLGGPAVVGAEELSQTELKALLTRRDSDALATLVAALEGNQGRQTMDAVADAVALGDADALDLARAILERPTDDGAHALDFAVLNGLTRLDSDEALSLVREQVLRLRPTESRYKHAVRVAAGILNRKLGEDALPKSAALAADSSRPLLDRALYLRVLIFAGQTDSPERDYAIRAYRPYLESSEVELQRAAVDVNSALDDSEVVTELRALADGSDPAVRSTANNLVKRYLQYGPDRPAPGQSVASPSWKLAHLEPYDARGLEEWMAHQEEWAAEQHRLLTGEEPPARLPDPPEYQLVPAAGVAPEAGGLAPYRP